MTQQLEYDRAGSPCLPLPPGAQTPAFLAGNSAAGFFDCMDIQNFKLSVCRFTPPEDMTLHECMPETDIFRLSFCLGGNMGFSFAEVPGKLLSVERGESCAITGGTARCVSEYEGGKEYYGLGVSFEPRFLRGVAECLQCENALNDSRRMANGLKRYAVTPHVSSILSQIAGSKMCGQLKALYLEGTLLELIAVYLDEVVCQRGKNTSVLPLSKEDMAALARAKEILDKNYVHPLTLAQLSQKVYLNAYKLKAGFKQLFGHTVYGYVLEKRMELAYLLLAQRRFRVGDVAGMVGYANTSHFIAAFSKKYGVTPGELGRNTP
ncbi:MAG: helix-turn-helix transcriptional regulator [Oscillospiraceae bacterium]